MKVFVTGASGYIGGSVAERLMAAGHAVTGLVRSEEKALLLRERGVEPVIGSLDDFAVLTQAAQAADAVIHAASAEHADSVVTLIAALERTEKTLIHTTGSSIVADSAGGEFAGSVYFTEDTYSEPVPFRRPRVAINRLVREAALDKGIRGIVICPPMIYGTGRGLNPNSEQLPKLAALAKQLGAGVYFGKGLNRYSNVHIDDLVELYLLVLEKAPGGSLYFAENGDASFLEIAEMVSRSLGLGGRTMGLSVEDVVRQAGEAGRYGVTSNSLVSAANARRLGWVPKGPSLAEFIAGA
ncbi:NAD-dependent epimerase/dehydratase family protein [Granulicella sp. WH15]|uniref:NAD-dependent epimerase/dehydratase family protein n=1 Tax=Granulicella sp. WH15 TaxID=2602070 RepID=UPI001367585A|nr:NAD-dependent epimerase/dehydratase family protein [Granulicella sp. WH15]QHN05145.1 NAD-dependent epimerase/dehydratase family protein [Granulicella sp. WH15]